MSENRNQDVGKQIGDTVRNAFESGDLSQLKNIGPVVQKAVKDNLSTASGGAQTQQKTYPSQDHTYPPPTGNAARQQQKPDPRRGRPYTPPNAIYRQQQRQQPPQQQRAQQGRPAWQGSARPAWQAGTNTPARATQPRPGYGVPSVVFGVMGMVTFGVAGIFLGLSVILGAATSLLGAAAASAAGFLLSGGLFGGGLGKRSLSGRIRRYTALFGQRDVLTIEEISRATGRSQKAVLKDIRRGMDKRLTRDMRLDVHETCLIRGSDAYQLYVETEQARKEREAEEAEVQRRMADPAAAPIETFKAEGKAVILKIRQANDAIPGEDISLKLDKLETTTARIVSYVEEHPEKLPDTRKFMNYYLPTTLKLVEKYLQYDAMDIQMDNVTLAKSEIEHTMDTINTAFTNLLESLYHEDTLDVATDIQVLETMLEQEGLTGKQFEIDGAS